VRTAVTTDDGVRLAVEVQGDGPLLLLVHGFTGAKEDFADQVPALARFATVARFDHRGHGESDKPDDAHAYSLDRLAADVLQVADALDFPRFRLLGWSMGGMAARRVVLAHPDRVDALVLMGTSPGCPSGVDPDMVEMGAAVALTEGMVVVRQLLDELDPLGTPADQRLKQERPGHLEYQRTNFFAVPPVAYAALIQEIAQQPNQLAELGSVACPTLVIVGEQDEPFLADCHAIAATIPGAELVVVPDAGHAPQFENPDVYLSSVQGFIRAHVGAEA
jgi:2-succinyl-6-hydroxy-2,4-cyclohexadiene-1-carboxylate synthase